MLYTFGQDSYNEDRENKILFIYKKGGGIDGNDKQTVSGFYPARFGID